MTVDTVNREKIGAVKETCCSLLMVASANNDKL